MRDPLEPFRAEFERVKDDVYFYGQLVVGDRNTFIDDCQSIIFGDIAELFMHHPVVRPAYRAAKALTIAETEGPDAAIIWKLGN